MALFDYRCAVRGTMRVWLLGTIFIWGVRKAKVQIPIQLIGRHKHLSHKQRKGLDGGGTILCLWEDELATHPWLHRSLAKLPTGSIPPSFVKHSGTFWVSLPLMITLYARQQKRHRCIEQSFGLCGRGQGWDDLGEWHWNMYNIIYEMNGQSRFNAGYWMLGAGALRRPRGIVQGRRREGGSGWGTRVYLWWIHVDVWQNQYNIVK